MTSAEVVYFQDSLAKVQYRPLCYIKLKFQTEQGQIITENLKVLMLSKITINIKWVVLLILNMIPKI